MLHFGFVRVISAYNNFKIYFHLQQKQYTIFSKYTFAPNCLLRKLHFKKAKNNLCSCEIWYKYRREDPFIFYLLISEVICSGLSLMAYFFTVKTE